MRRPGRRSTETEARRARWRRLIGYLLPLVGVAVLTWAAFEIVGLRVVRVSKSVALRQADPPAEDAAMTGEAVIGEATDGEALTGEAAPGLAEEAPRNVILVIADGFGFAHLTLARTAIHGINGAAVWDRFSHVGWQWTHPVVGFMTDSAAAATALATGQAAHYGAVAVDRDGRPLETLFERAVGLGYRTGIVTDSYIWDATPAAFVTHVPLRGNESAGAILSQLGASSLELLVGELEDVGEGEVPGWAASVERLSARFDVLGPEADAAMLRRLETAASPTVAIFEEDQVTDLASNPNLPNLAAAALRRFESDERPFLLLLESEEQDSAGHENDFGRALRGLEALDEMLTVALDFASERGDTLVVFTSDHDTGGLALGIADWNNLQLEAIWASKHHTGSVVPVLASGPGAEAFAGSYANWELGRLLDGALQRP